MKHAEITELLGAWALDAVDPDEAVTVERHVATCPRCRLEVAEHRDVAARLAFEGESAPEGVWDRIAASLEETPPPLDMARIIPIDAGRRGRSVRLPFRTAVVIGAAAAIVIAALGIEVERLDARTQHLGAAVAQGDEVGRIAAQPGIRTVALHSTDGGFTATAFFAADGDSAIDGRNLPSLPPDREYQLWGTRDGVSVSLRLLGDQPGFVTFRAGQDVDHLAVTDEPAGGVVAPGGAPVVSGAV